MNKLATQHRRAAVFISHYHEHFRGTILPICKLLKGQNQLEPLVILRDDPGDRMASTCEFNGINHHSLRRSNSVSTDQYQRLTSPTTGDAQTPPNRNDLSARTLERSSVACALAQFESYWSLRIRMSRCTRLLKRMRAAVVIVPDDRTILGIRWIAAARRLGLPTVTVQWALYHQEKTLVRLRGEDQYGRYTTSPTRKTYERIAKQVPGASRIYNDRRVWFIPPVASVSLNRIGGFPARSAFVFGGGQSDVATFFGSSWKQRTTSVTHDDSGRISAGHPDQDRWYSLLKRTPSNVRSESLAASGLALSKPWVTMIMPALSFFKIGGPMASEVTKESLLRDFVSIVNALMHDFPDLQICVKPHPRDSATDFHELRRLHDSVHIIENINTDDLVRASDVVLCQWSTVAMMATALQRPLVVYDFYGSTASELFDDVLDVRTAKTLEELRAYVQCILHDTDVAKQLQHRQNESVKGSLRLDGNAAVRISGIIESLATTPRFIAT